MLIAIEGCDGAGKSTLIEQLRKNAERYFLIVRSSGYPKRTDVRLNYLQSMGRLRFLMSPEHVICDRYIAISESIYGPICRKTPEWTEDDLRNELSPVDVVVYCRPPSSVIEKGLLANTQMKGVEDNFLDIVEEYDRRIDWIKRFTQILVIEYDWTLFGVPEAGQFSGPDAGARWVSQQVRL